MRIVIVGGVAGGMSCAARARRLDESAEIIVIERGAHPSFANCGLPYFVGGEITDERALLVQTPASLRAALNLDVRPHSEVVAVDTVARTVTVAAADGTYTLDYDALVLSPGASAVRPPIPGIDAPHVQTLRTVEDAVALRDRVTAGTRAVVLGAGFIGVEAAEALAQRGVEVALVELAAHPLPPVEPELASLVADELRRLGIDVRTGIAASAVDGDAVVLEDGTRLPADVVVLSVGVRPDTAVFEDAGIACERGAIVVDEHGRTSADRVWAAGDATLSVDAVTGIRRPVALAGPANRAGRLIADDILGTGRRVPPPVGTAIVRVGELTAALTGANRASLRAAGIAFETIHLHPNQHAGYFPGVARLSMVVHFGADDGRLLGAQIVGTEGVDKRIDVIATAMRFGAVVDDLIDLDLAYSPPYGQAKDAVNLTGLVGQNVRTGTLRLWYADDLEAVRAEALVLDVRRADEVAKRALPDALHIPHTELRERLDEVRAAAAGRPVRVLCQSGVRSAIAHRVLTQAGFDSASLSGGMLTLHATLGDHPFPP
ncbi:FAD-dependent oxidoreductase [Microbacterium sp. No. 7]|uniref:FAD-dependent oxidoreductase n=1 Tax=Microbacterium sp. No. 7 TaxID=1714373 RepID=UPI0006D1FC02|nr:FAD-dependent oxidoreductase [Microbacterium sp. No. 7]ALJ18703.1 pyridine nucleotide-disulfide oxidoreductase [Microbacterium sp. No. 7]